MRPNGSYKTHGSAEGCYPLNHALGVCYQQTENLHIKYPSQQALVGCKRASAMSCLCNAAHSVIAPPGTTNCLL